MKFKRTFWLPLALGVAFGLLAGIATVTGLSFMTPGTNIENAIGIWMTLILLSAALGGPIAGLITSTLFILIATFFGPPDMKAVLNDPINFWTNIIVTGIFAALVGFIYRFIFERNKLLTRLLLWAGTVIAFYLISSPFTIGIQFFLHGETGALPAILSSYRIFLPQAMFDIFFTSLVFIALPRRFNRPSWYVPEKAGNPKSTITGIIEKDTF